jgi:AcrR family transcriptional regulator
VIKIDRASFQRKNILKNSFDLFKSKGYNNTTTREIAQASGIRKGLLHYYYNQKEDIIIEIYDNILTSLNNLVDREHSDKINGCTYYAVLNILYFRTMSSRPYLTDLLSEMMLSHNLTQIKIEKSVKSCFRIIQKYKLDITEYQLFLATIVAAGAEAELLSNIRHKKVKMTYDKLATTINKILFTMLKISENDIKISNDEALKFADSINIDNVIDYIKENNSWLENL